MTVLVITVILVVGAGFILFGIYQESERKAARPLEVVTRKDMEEGNISSKVPVVEELSDK